jgi:hypothetical protein
MRLLIMLVCLCAAACGNPVAPSEPEGCARATATGIAIDLHVKRSACPDDPIQHAR